MMGEAARRKRQMAEMVRTFGPDFPLWMEMHQTIAQAVHVLRKCHPDRYPAEPDAAAFVAAMSSGIGIKAAIGASLVTALPTVEAGAVDDIAVIFDSQWAERGYAAVEDFPALADTRTAVLQPWPSSLDGGWERMRFTALAPAIVKTAASLWTLALADGWPGILAFRRGDDVKFAAPEGHRTPAGGHFPASSGELVPVGSREHMRRVAEQTAGRLAEAAMSGLQAQPVG